MKKLAYLTAFTAIALTPALAQAEVNTMDETANTRTYTETVVYYQPSNAAVEASIEDIQGTYPLADGSGSIQIKGEGVYLIDDSGFKFPAPNGSHTAQNGISFVSEDGLLLRTETPPEMAVLRVDAKDHNDNGMTDDIDVDVYTR